MQKAEPGVHLPSNPSTQEVETGGVQKFKSSFNLYSELETRMGYETLSQMKTKGVEGRTKKMGKKRMGPRDMD